MSSFEINNESVAKIELGLSKDENIDERPLVTDFSLSLASEKDKAYIIAQTQSMQRQTMNLRTSESVQIIMLRDDKSKQIRGWAGLDLTRTENYSELFSSYLEAGYRHYLLWLAMTHVRCQLALNMGVEALFFRVSEVFARDVEKAESITNIYDVLVPESIDPSFRDLCQKCELFGRTCNYRAFLSMDVPRMVQHVQLRIGTLPSTFPMSFVLDPKFMRTRNRGPGSTLKWKRP